MEKRSFQSSRTLKDLKDKEFAVGRVCVFWDIENLSPPSIIPGGEVCAKIATFAQNFGIIDSINTFGDSQKFKKELRTDIQHSGINFFDVPSGKKNAADTAILVDMLLFAVDNKPPATIILISGDGDFSNALSRLKQRGYTMVLVCSNEKVSQVLGHVCNFVFDWNEILGTDSLPPPNLSPEDAKLDQKVQENFKPLIDFLLKSESFKASLDSTMKELSHHKLEGFSSVTDFLKEAQLAGVISCYQMKDGNVKLRLRSHYCRTSYISLADLIGAIQMLKKDFFPPVETMVRASLAKRLNVKKIHALDWNSLLEMAERSGFKIVPDNNERLIFPPSGDYPIVDSRVFEESLVTEQQWNEFVDILSRLEGVKVGGKLRLAEVIKENATGLLKSMPMALISSMVQGAIEQNLVHFDKRLLVVGNKNIEGNNEPNGNFEEIPEEPEEKLSPKKKYGKKQSPKEVKEVKKQEKVEEKQEIEPELIDDYNSLIQRLKGLKMRGKTKLAEFFRDNGPESLQNSSISTITEMIQKSIDSGFAHYKDGFLIVGSPKEKEKEKENLKSEEGK